MIWNQVNQRILKNGESENSAFVSGFKGALMLRVWEAQESIMRIESANIAKELMKSIEQV